MKNVIQCFSLIVLFLLYSSENTFSQSQYFFSIEDSINSEIKTDKGKKSPTTAMILSAVLPGAGQIYNESYWKIPIILGLSGYWGYELLQKNKNYTDYKNLYSESLIKSPPSGNYRYKLLRDFYKDERDKFAWYLGILYVVNIVDAYVDASLFEFDVSDDLAMMGTGYNSFQLKVKLFF